MKKKTKTKRKNKNTNNQRKLSLLKLNLKRNNVILEVKMSRIIKERVEKEGIGRIR